MRQLFISLAALLVMGLVLTGTAFADESSSDECVECHKSGMPGIIKQWEESKHSEAGVGCYNCHEAKSGDPSGYEHNGYEITAVPSPRYCEECHPGEVEQNSKSKHAWGAFMGPLKPYYTKARAEGLDPFSQETARLLDPEKMAKTALTPLFPDSGILKKIGLLDNPEYHHNNVNLGCIECHGSFMIAEPGGELKGWPNAGVGRINPDGSLGSCTYCHTRHKFSIEEARKPETCGQCHLGPDHPQHEIYEESKHGNIYAASGDDWNWDAPAGELSSEDIVAPTCAVCHMSALDGVVENTHDVSSRLYWELQPKKSVPQWKGPDEVDLVLERVPDKEKAEAGRATMKKVCYRCHSPQWADNYLDEFDKVVSDYNMLWEYTDNLLKQAYEEGLISKDNPLDETPEIMHYLVWHHDGRRWRMGASMMGPDWTHWNGAVDAIMNKLGTMINDIEMRRRLKKLESKSE
ncbi:multiheme c-type cytochrome [Candidatus Poribacteria bacterium]